MPRKRRLVVEKVVERLDSTMKRLEDLELLVDSDPEYSELSPLPAYSIGVASHRDNRSRRPLKITSDIRELATETKDRQGAYGDEV